ncbi:MAG: hypothetical protein P857_982 [Candidatus Xenolissoclinum pacificiensis L6]|uniref:Uncharacterized protein n=1 Tax=Candidatus Xenolissoclinum pacificiensis L6 TaxID=1401685 RepID=W2V0M9_9RICK|nr:MAG: hypothetical protein P857_982 [Candidatus Xenolissoclinum pacificiensis L6]
MNSYTDISILFIYLLMILIPVIIYRSYNIILDLILMSVMSIICTSFYVLLRAGDVAITEACINVFLSTAFFVIVVFFTKKYDTNMKNNSYLNYMMVFFAFLVSVLFVKYIYDAPILGIYENITNNDDIYGYYLNNTYYYFKFPNVVAAILAGYRGFDTLFETVVIFISSLSVYSIVVGNYDKR